ncbi:MAG: pilus assembly protein TadG-related protein [Candidatus Nanopelagicales bacterium]|jgi:Flp pilus assembly protein TadG
MRVRPRDEGSILVLSLGFIVICILALAVVVDASTVFLARRALQSQADGAALAGAQAIDLDSYYAKGASARIRLDATRVRGAVERHVRRDPGDGRLTGVSLRQDVVVVTMTDRVRPPFSGWLTPLGAYDLDVEAGAVLSYRPAD